MWAFQMLIRIFVTALALSLSMNAWATKEALFIGGGGEPAGKATIFDEMYQNFMSKTSSAGWNTQSVFDGGHSDSEILAKNLTKSSNTPMSTANVDAAFENIKRRLATGELKSGDSLMIAIGTHGRPRSGEDTHGIDTTDGSISLDKINQIKELAEAQGVKLAVMDMSCYSGNTQQIASDKTCVISASDGSTVGYNSTGSSLFGNLNKGQSLESAFLNMRNDPNSIVPATPIISTPAGKAASSTTSALSQEMIVRGQLQDNYCATLDQNQISKITQELREINKGAEDPLEKELSQAVQGYQDVRASALKKFDEAQTLNRVCVKNEGQNRCTNYQTAIANYNKLNAMVKTTKLPPNFQKLYEQYKTLWTSPEYLKYQQAETLYNRQAFDLTKEANQVAMVERKIYRKIYDQAAAKSKGPNACKDFVL
jgi:hypothetical protein